MSDDRAQDYGGQNQYTGADGMKQTCPSSNFGGQRQLAVEVPGEGRVVLTPADIALVKQCASECFRGRIIPLTVISCGAIFYLGKIGRISPSAFKYVGAFIGSTIVGKLSYGNSCNQKIINSNLHTPFAESVRKQEKGNSFAMNTYGFPSTSDSWNRSGDRSDDSWSKPIPNSRFGSRSEQQNVKKWGDSGFVEEESSGFVKEGLNYESDPNINDPFRESASDKLNEDAKLNEQKFTSYDELRHKNRSSFKF